MLDMKSLLLMLFNSWGVITVVLIGALVYRGTLSSKEDDLIFILMLRNKAISRNSRPSSPGCHV